MATIYRAASHTLSASPPKVTSFAHPKLPRSWKVKSSSKMVGAHRVCSFLSSPPIFRAAPHTHRISHAPAFVPNPSRTRFAPQKLLTSSYSSKMVGVRCSSAAANEMNQGVAEFYDNISGMWEDLWGDHMHHGFYDVSANQHQHHDHLSHSDHRAAQIRMIEEALSFAGVPDEEEKRPRRIVDVGCGLGGSARHLARKYGSSVKGITISPLQVDRSNFLTSAAGLTDKVEFLVGDALNQPFPDGHFDLVWSLECAEHIPDKKKFVKELVRVTAPGGRMIIVTACKRDLLPAEDSLKPNEQELLDKICKAIHYPAWFSRSDYVKVAQSMHLEDIKTADWTENVAPFGSGVIEASRSWKAIGGLLKSGWKTIKSMVASSVMQKGYDQGLIKYTIISARKAT